MVACECGKSSRQSVVKIRHIKGRTQIEGANRVYRRIYGAKRNKITKIWREFHKEELHNLYSSSIRRVINVCQ
jgi:hypothetical protein